MLMCIIGGAYNNKGNKYIYFTCGQLYWGKQSRLKGDRKWGWKFVIL